MDKTFPTLYKKTNTGAIAQWTISVFGDQISVEFGQVGGALQRLTETISAGKNEGKANVTTAEEQALKEAAAKHKKQIGKRYVPSLDAAKMGEVDTGIVQGGIPPMLAPNQIWPHFKKKVQFPVFMQPKLDGHRIIAVLNDGKCTLWTRRQKPINSLPHIVEAIETAFEGQGNLILDGEGYNHDYRNDFEELSSMIRSSEPEDGHWNVQYHIYDLPSCKKNFGERNKELIRLFSLPYFSTVRDEQDVLEGIPFPLVLVDTKVADNDDDIQAIHDVNLEAEYEGSMIRNDGPYEQDKRSKHLQKLKVFIDWELPIVGVNEGTGKDAGTVASFVCALPEGGTTNVRLKASYPARKKLLENPDLWIGMNLTLKYQNRTADGKLRFANGKEIVGKGLRNGTD